MAKMRKTDTFATPLLLQLMQYHRVSRLLQFSQTLPALAWEHESAGRSGVAAVRAFDGVKAEVGAR